MTEITNHSNQALIGFAQGIRCGNLALALPYGWARMVVDEFSVTAVPRAPFWLLGASSINGTVTPVVDLQLFALGPNAAQDSGARKKRRLLVGGIADGESNKTLAILFDDLPIQIDPSAEVMSAQDAGFAQFGQALTGQIVRQRETVYRMLAPETLYEVLTTQLSRH